MRGYINCRDNGTLQLSVWVRDEQLLDEIKDLQHSDTVYHKIQARNDSAIEIIDKLNLVLDDEQKRHIEYYRKIKNKKQYEGL
ncbi:MAG: hypothetical protein ACE5ES_00080 [Candidatus Nanoarchaeia archaeon]